MLIYGVQGVASLQMIIGQVAAVGGVGMLISGILHYQQGSNFGSSAFGLYGLFYISLGIVLYPIAGTAEAYPVTEDYNTALGLYLLVWFLLSIVMWPVTWRINIGLTVLFTFVWLYFLFLAVGFMLSHKQVIQTGGAFGMCVGAWSYILGMEHLYAEDDCIFKIPNPSLAKKNQFVTTSPTHPQPQAQPSLSSTQFNASQAESQQKAFVQ